MLASYLQPFLFINFMIYKIKSVIFMTIYTYIYPDQKKEKLSTYAWQKVCILLVVESNIFFQLSLALNSELYEE